MAKKLQFLIKHLSLVVFSVASVFAVGCAQISQGNEGADCNQSHVEILQAIRSNGEIRDYVWTHFKSPRVSFLWDEMSKEMEACSTGKEGIKIYRLSSRDFDESREYVIIYKMYFDDDAAFVQMGFSPSGRYVDAFLRKRDGKWLVQQHLAWVH